MATARLVSDLSDKPMPALPPAIRTTNQSGSRLFTLPPELRNLIYEYAFSEVEDEVAIRLSGGPNAGYPEQRYNAVKRRVVLEDEEDEPSQLAILLTCKQINAEASPIAFSKMSFWAMTFSHFSYSFTDHVPKTLADVEGWLGNLDRVFTADKLKFVKRLILDDECLILSLVMFCDHKVKLLAKEKGTHASPSMLGFSAPLQALSHVEEIVYDIDDSVWGPREVVKGASWVSLALEPDDEDSLLAILPKLKSIIVKRDAGEQTSIIVNGHIIAAESGMRLGGRDDLEKEYRER